MSMQKKIIGRTLASDFPHVAKQWHPTKNGSLKPVDVAPSTHKAFWWKCPKGHVWKARVNNRTRGSGCPRCHVRKKKKVSEEYNLSVIYPHLAKEWHPLKNDPVTPFGLSPGSARKVWWKCKKGHEWQAAVCMRTLHGIGCPYCSGRYPTRKRNFAKTYPDLTKEWHPWKNGEKNPDDFTPKSKFNAWWICRKKHVWQALIKDRANGHGCPYCSNHRVSKENNLAVVDKNLAKEWHPSLNLDLTPYDVVAKSHKKVWWKCKKGHEWEATLTNRSKGKGCPYCCNRKISPENSLKTIKPALAKEWHPALNGDSKPVQFAPRSHFKVWWLCKKGHEWQAPINNRVAGNGCPVCSNRIVVLENSLAACDKELSREWHPVKNGNLTPEKVFLRSSKKVWWKCKNGHEWKCTVRSRAGGSSCPYCSFRKVSKDNCLAVTNRNLSLEWHPSLNKPLKPSDVTHISGKKVWWLCRKGHQWKATISRRASFYILNRKGTGCPYCARKDSKKNKGISPVRVRS